MAFVPKRRVNPSTLPPLMSIIVDSPPNIGPHPPQLEDVRKPGYKRIGSAVFPRGSGGPPGKYHYKDIYFNSSNLSPLPSRSRPVDDQQVSKRQCIPLLDIRLHSSPLEDTRKNGCRRIGSAGLPRGSGGPSGNYHYKNYVYSSNNYPISFRSRPVDDRKILQSRNFAKDHQRQTPVSKQYDGWQLSQ